MHASGGILSMRMAVRGLEASLSNVAVYNPLPSMWDGGAIALSAYLGHADPAYATSSTRLTVTSSQFWNTASLLGSGGLLSVQSSAASMQDIGVLLRASQVEGCVAPGGAGGCIAAARSSHFPWTLVSSTAVRPTLTVEI